MTAKKYKIMIRVIIESPYAGDIELNVKYARECLRDSLNRGEAPIASHLLYTQEGVLDDNDPKERQKGIEAGLALRSVAEKHIFYIDRGMSKGMDYALKWATDRGFKVEFRNLYKDL